MANKTLPTGTVTFLFTDIEGSTKLWQEQPEAMAIAHARHDEILRTAIESNNGYVFQIVGDSFSAAFHNASDGLRAMLAAQRGLNQTSEVSPTGTMSETSEVLRLRVRMGLHTGSAEILPDGKYEGYATIASTQRVMSAAHGGQTLLTQTTFELLQNTVPDDVTLHDMGEHRLKDLRAPLRLYQVNVPDLPQDFPVIKSLDTQPNKLPAQLTSFIGREKEICYKTQPDPPCKHTPEISSDSFQNAKPLLQSFFENSLILQSKVENGKHQNLVNCLIPPAFWTRICTNFVIVI